MKLNPNKCSFGVTSSKFLDFIVSQHRIKAKHGIKANPKKIRALQKMKPLRMVKEIQHLTRRITALSRFLWWSAEKSLPIFRALKQMKDFQWTKECQAAFDELKRYLNSPPPLSKPEPNGVLYLYLIVSPQTVSSILIRQEGMLQKPMYYMSRVLHEAIMILAKRLCPYFQAYIIAILTN